MKKTIVITAAFALAMSAGTAHAAEPELSVPFSNGTMTSTYHLFGDSPGLLVWMDGSGGYAIANPDSPYALGGPDGLRAVAEKHNMTLLVPEAPGPDCDGQSNCWYDSAAVEKAAWARDLIVKVKADHGITGPVVVGGYSSGAQATTTIVAAHGQDLGVTLGVPVSFGSPPRGVDSLPDGYKPAMVFNTGADDREALGSAKAGAEWFRSRGAAVETTWPAGVGHDRSGDFGGIVDAALTDLVPVADVTPLPTPTVTPSPTATPTATTPAATAAPTASPLKITGRAESGCSIATYSVQGLTDGVTFEVSANIDGEGWEPVSTDVAAGSVRRDGAETVAFRVVQAGEANETGPIALFVCATPPTVTQSATAPTTTAPTTTAPTASTAPTTAPAPAKDEAGGLAKTGH